MHFGTGRSGTSPRGSWLAGLIVAAALCAPGATAYGSPPGASSDAAPTHKVPDTIGQRLQACVVCHGKEGRATPEGYLPRIAGKPSGYLYNQLLNFRDGRRRNTAMGHLLAHLSDDYLREMAEYFAALELPYPAPQGSDASPSTLDRGEALVRHGDPVRSLPACVECHGQELTGVEPAVPGLLGLPRDYLAGQLGAWKNGMRHAHAPDCMAEIADRLSPGDVSALVNWLSSQPVSSVGRPAIAGSVEPSMPCGGVPR